MSEILFDSVSLSLFFSFLSFRSIQLPRAIPAGRVTDLFSFIYLLIYLFIYPFTFIPFFSFMYSFIYSLIYLFIYLFVCLFTYLFIYLFIYCILHEKRISKDDIANEDASNNTLLQRDH